MTPYREIIRILFEEAWNQARFERFIPHIAPVFTLHVQGKTIQTTVDQLRQIVDRWHSAFPDFHFEIEDLLCEGERVAVRLTLTGTHQGTWKGINATGHRIAVSEMFFFRFEDGLLVEGWEEYDERVMFRQLGAVPE